MQSGFDKPRASEKAALLESAWSFQRLSHSLLQNLCSNLARFLTASRRPLHGARSPSKEPNVVCYLPRPRAKHAVLAASTPFRPVRAAQYPLGSCSGSCPAEVAFPLTFGP